MKKTKIDNIILDIIDSNRRGLSISQVTKILREEFEIKVSPQIVKRYLLKLKREGKIVEI